VVYQIYPRSFKDSNDDGIGDLPGIISKLDYLAGLGVSAIWLSPVYTSPMIDFGYDVADYTAIDPVFGTMADMDRLIAEAHARDIKVILDLVFNHTSDQHEWFKASRSSRDNPKRDWYIWRDAAEDGELPNNWLSVFGGPAWEFDPHTQQYYMHSFAKQQPDLNWQNPEVRAAAKQVMRFWLERDVDGFRMDAVNWYAKDPLFRNDPPNPEYDPQHDSPYDGLLHYNSRDHAEIYDCIRVLTDVLEAYDERFMLIEADFDTPLDVDSYFDFYDRIDTRVAAPFNFIDLYLPWNAQSFRSFIDSFQAGLKPGRTPIYTAANHDRSRLATRIGTDATKPAAVLFLTLPGATAMYYGQEIGMEDVSIPDGAVRDKLEKRPGSTERGRDPERTPMQWSAEHYAGFSTHKPWLPVGPNYQVCNVAAESADPASLLNLYKKLFALRASSNVIKKGDYQPLNLMNSDLFGFTREYRGDKLAIVINFSHTDTIACPVSGNIILSTCDQGNTRAELQPLEARIVQINA